MRGSLQELDFLRIHGVILVSFGNQISDLHISYRVNGKKSGYVYLIALIGMDYGIIGSRLVINWVLWIDLSRSNRSLQGLDSRIALDLILNSEGLRQAGIAISSFQPIDLLKSDFGSIIDSFLLLILWRILRVKSISSGIDLTLFQRRFKSSNIWLIWKFWGFKGRGRVANCPQLSSFWIIYSLYSYLIITISGLCGLFLLRLLSASLSVTMSQSSLLGKDAVEKSLGSVVSRMRIKIPKFDNLALIKGYAKTMIGRCMNPRLQDMKGLLLMFPRIYQVEGRVAGADIGLGRFQLDFDEEEDIAEVLKMEPFHFDGWMVSLVRWKPSVDPAYPSTLTFWVRVLGIPIEYWAEPFLEAVGGAIGKVVAVDIDVGRVQVIVDGFKPLCFETTIEFDDGEETLVSLRYERLYGYCSYCFSMCHDVEHCEKKNGIKKPSSQALESGDGVGSYRWSYKGAVSQGRQPHIGNEGKGKGIAIGSAKEDERNGHSHLGKEGKGKEIALESDRAEEREFTHNSQAHGKGKGNQSRFIKGEGSSRVKRFTNYAQFNDHRFNEMKKMKAKVKEATKVKVVDSTEVQAVQAEAFKPKKIVRKSLVFEGEAGVSSEQQLEHKVQSGEENEEDGAEMEANQIVPEEGELNSPTTGAVSLAGMVIMEVENVADTGRKDSEHSMSDSFSEVIPETLWDQSDGNFLFQGNENLESLEALLEGDVDGIDGTIELSNMETEVGLDEVDANDKDKANQISKKKQGKGTMVLAGVNSRKRNVQVLVTPRKRTEPKDGASTGDGANPKNQDKEKGNPGGPKPPKPSA